MKILKLLFIFLLSFESLSSKNTDANRSELLRLVNERKELYDKYSASLSQKSGFFGNRTKNDLKDSHEKLLEIVAIDNKIMNSLTRTLDYRDFEKQNMSYDVNSFEDRIRNLNILNDTLSKQNLNFARDNKFLDRTNRKYHLYIGLLILLLIVSWGRVIRNKFRK